MNSETVELVRELAERLGIATGQLIDLFMPRVIASATLEVIASCVIALGVVFFIPRSWAVECDDSMDTGFKRVALAIIGIVASIFILAMLHDSVTTLASPRAAAIIEILHVARGES